MEPDFRAAVNEFILECSEISRRLDAISTRDDRRGRVVALELGRREYGRLETRRAMLAMTAAEARLVQIMLDGLLARLKFLEKRA